MVWMVYGPYSFKSISFLVCYTFVCIEIDIIETAETRCQCLALERKKTRISVCSTFLYTPYTLMNVMLCKRLCYQL